MPADPRLPTLSVVIPVYNEPLWIGRTVADLVAALERSPFREPEMLIVDDGSDEETKRALAELEVPFDLEVIEQENRGRFMARVAGIQAARGELVLLLDSRTSLDPEALAFVAPHVQAGRRVWNGHCMIDTTSGPFAKFWDTITFAAYRDYLGDPRTTSFGPQEYDRFPKGTTHFLCPREYLLEAIGRFSSFYEDPRNANDDTSLLRHVAERERINISPGFASLYRSRTSLRPFLRHAMHRGVVFFDGFGRRGTRFFPVVVAHFPLSLAAALLALARPKIATAAVAGAPLAAGAVAAGLRRPWPHVASFALLAPPFAVVYSLGIWKGALLALRARRPA